MLTDPNIQQVIAGFRYSNHLASARTLDVMQHKNTALRQERQRENISQLCWQGLESTVMQLEAASKQVFILLPIPDLKHDILSLVSASGLGIPEIDLARATISSYYHMKNEHILEQIEALPNRIQRIDPAATFWLNGYCAAATGDDSLYFDDNHLSVRGSEYLLEQSRVLRRCHPRKRAHRTHSDGLQVRRGWITA